MSPTADRQSEADRALVREVIEGILGVWEPYHRKWMDKANHFYGLYRNYQDYRAAARSSSTPRGRDMVRGDAETEFGPELFIPMAFSTVETVLPAMLSQNPKMVAYARKPWSEPNVENVKALLEAQQEQIQYPLRLQTIAKDGLITGLGVQKTYWKQDYRIRKGLVSDPASGMMVARPHLVQLFDDPDADAVDPFDFICDPFAARIELADGAFHRTWRSTRYVKRMAETGQWRNLEDTSFEDMKHMGSSPEFARVWNERLSINERYVSSGGGGGSIMGKEDVHEILEFHDGERVVTILNRELVVASGENPNWHGELPFQVFRPTELPHQLHGIGEIEPIEQLQEELNTLRTQRRYNADLVLQRVFAYHEGHVDREEIQFGPGWAIGVNGDPRELLFPIQVGDIPNSGYQEEDRIGADIDRTSGISDTIAGGGMEGGGTATGYQLVQSAASRRIEFKTRRMEKEIVAPGAQQFIALDQQHIVNNRDVAVPALPTPDQPDRRWAWWQLGPEELAGEFRLEVEENSSQPENIPQERADAQMLMTLFAQVPGIDQQKLAHKALEKMGVGDPRAILSPPAPMIPAETLNRLQQRGVPDRMIAEALAEAGGPNLLGGAEPGGLAGEGPVPPAEGGPPVQQPPQLPAGGESTAGREPEPAAAG